MQFPVPQFTDVEDRIIANLTFRQFGILLVTGGLVFFTYSVSKDLIVTGFAAFLLGLPGIILAFAQFNGRPMYRSISVLVNFLMSNKVMAFRKESWELNQIRVSSVKLSEPVKIRTLGEDPRTRLKKIQYQLEQRATEEVELLKK